jgi:FkbM family methyltransferase
MNEAIKRRIRPVLLPCIHGWQWFYDYSRGMPRECQWAMRKFGYRLRMIGSRPVVVENVRGIRFAAYSFDLPNLRFLMCRPSDAAEFEAMSRLVQPGDIAFDVGANIGIYSAFLARLCGPAGRVWAFEPVPETYRRLRETLTLNGCDNAVTVEAAVSDKPGSARMNLFEPRFADLNTLGSPSVAMASWNTVSPIESVIVRACTLDEFCETQRIERINFLKVDVEGFELAVFRGAERLLGEQRVDYICFEIFQPALKDAGIESREVFAILRAHGYLAYRFDITAGAFQGPLRDSPQELSNFFASSRDLSGLKVPVHGGGRVAHEGSPMGKAR